MSLKKGYGITFVDLDETLFRTFAKINVVKEEKSIAQLTNQEFSSYVLKEGESFDFGQFKDGKLFRETSIPIPRTVEMIKRMIHRIKETKSYSRIVVLTAREDFYSKDLFLQSFSDQGIDVSDKNVFYIERAGNIDAPTIAEQKRIAILKYLKTGIYRRCRMIDDDLENIRMFLSLAKGLPEDINRKVCETYSLNEKDVPIKFYALQLQQDGKIKKI